MRVGISTTTSRSTSPIPPNVNRYGVQARHNDTGILGTVAGAGFFETNIKWSINGYIYGNMGP
jgi:hypothetical protein